MQQLAAIETLIGQTLQRQEEDGFEAEHRVPVTAPGGQITKKPKKPKQSKVLEGKPGKVHLGSLLDDKPQVKAVRKAPGFGLGGKPAGGKPSSGKLSSGKPAGKGGRRP